MTNSERSKILKEQAIFLNKEAESLKSLAQSGSVIGELGFTQMDSSGSVKGSKPSANTVNSVADDIEAEGC
jgi:hypothetical protein